MTPEQFVINRQSFYRLVKGLAVIAIACLAVIWAFWAYAQERHDLPPFDQAKASALSPEKRAEYDRLLFNELPDWNAGSLRHDLYSREAEWKKMAADGHEISYWILQTRSPTMGMFPNTQALKRLDELAQQGDASAMCAYVWVVASPDGKDKQYLKAIGYLERGANLGHPECLKQLGRITIGNSAPALRGNVKTDIGKGYAMLVAAARQGYNGARSLWLYFDNKGFVKAADVERAYCWATIDEQFESPMPERLTTRAYLLDRVREYATKNKRQDLLQLADQLENSPPATLEKCVALGLK